MSGLVDCGVVLTTALPSGNAFFTSFAQSLQGLVASTVYLNKLVVPDFYKLSVARKDMVIDRNGLNRVCFPCLSEIRSTRSFRVSDF